MIGILGGSGAVGRSAAAVLASAGAGPIRIGGRNGDATAAVARVVGGEARAVDVTDPSALAGFVSGCRVVVNCAGPSRRLGAVVAAAAAEAGADLVDAGGGGATSASGSRRVALTHAGALPGLSGLLPRWLAAREFDAVRELTLYVAVRDRFTSVGAEDYLDGVLSPETVPGGCWCSGRVVPDPVGRTRVTLPHMDDAWASPYVDDEARSVAAALALERGRWYAVSRSTRLAGAVARARGLDRVAAVEELCLATALDAAGREPSVLVVLAARGTLAGRDIDRTAVVRSGGIAELTGAVTAVAARQVLAGTVPPGAHRAADVLDPLCAVDDLSGPPIGLDIAVRDHVADTFAAVEEGAL